MIIMQVSVQIGLNWYLTGTELGNGKKNGENSGPVTLLPADRNCECVMQISKIVTSLPSKKKIGPEKFVFRKNICLENYGE